MEMMLHITGDFSSGRRRDENDAKNKMISLLFSNPKLGRNT
jgi:hypothetical protein